MADVNKAIAEGRRIYVGSLRYNATPADIESLLTAHDLPHDKIHMSIDPISARNPGYCFIELPTAEEAARALEVLNGQDLLGRPIKTGPCEAKTGPSTGSSNRNSRSSFDRGSTHRSGENGGRVPAFQRWGDWRGSSAGQSAEGGAYVERKEHPSQKHIDEYAANTDGRRLFVSGLPKMLNQQENEAEMRDFFQGFAVTAIGKRVTPYRFRGMSDTGVNYHHCFVDVSTAEEAAAAVDALNGQQLGSGGQTVRVSIAKPNTGGQQPREDRETNGTRTRGDGKQREERKERPGMASMSWRRAE